MVISWLLHSVTNDIAESVVYCQSASAIWDELEQRFGQASGARIFQVQRELCQISQGSISVSSYFTKIKRFWDEYGALIKIPTCNCGAGKEIVALLQSQKLMQFLMGLNESYKTVRGNILMISPLPSVSHAYQMILKEEKQRDVYSTSRIQNDSAALYSGNDRFGKTQPKGNNPGAVADKRTQLFCRYCKKQGHAIEKCFKLHGFPGGNGNMRGRKVAGNRVWVRCKDLGMVMMEKKTSMVLVQNKIRSILRPA